MKVLGIDTATSVCGVALTENGRLVADSRTDRQNVHNEQLVANIQTLMSNVGLQLPEIDAIAVSIGPGSFTGLRIGLSVAKGLAFSLGKPLTCVNTMDAFAAGAFAWNGPVCVILKARENEVYAARFEKSQPHRAKRVSDYMLLKTSEVPGLIQQNALVVVNPPGLAGSLEIGSAVLAPLPLLVSSPLNIAILGHEMLIAGKTADVDLVEPFYLKDFVPKKASKNVVVPSREIAD